MTTVKPRAGKTAEEAAMRSSDALAALLEGICDELRNAANGEDHAGLRVPHHGPLAGLHKVPSLKRGALKMAHDIEEVLNLHYYREQTK